MLSKLCMSLATTLAIATLMPLSAYAVAAIKVDQFTGVTTVETDWLSAENTCSGFLNCLANTSRYQYRLSGVATRGFQSITHCLTVRYEGESWAFFDSANDKSGVTLKVAILDRRIGQAWDNKGVTEAVCVELSKPYLAAQNAAPLVVQIAGKYKKFVINVPVSMMTEYLESVKAWPETGSFIARRVVLGVQYLPINRETLLKASIDADSGYGVLTVSPSSLGETSGIRIGDIILKIDDLPVPVTENLAALAQNWTAKKPGKLTIYRAGQMIDLNVTP